MNQEFWKRLCNFSLGSFLAGLVLILLIAFVGPGPGAPEGERVLGFGSMWLSRIDYQLTPEGVHSWNGRTNWWAFGILCLLAGLLGAATFPAKTSKDLEETHA